MATDPVPPAVPPVETVPLSEVNSRIEAARTEERSKLHATIEAIQAKLDTANLSVAQLQAIEAKLADATTQLATLSKAKTASGEIDLRAVIAETTAAVRGQIDEAKKAELSQLQARLDAVEAENKRAKLDALKQQLVSAANGKIIPAMVVGNTEQEIRASADASMKQFSDIESQVKASSGTPPPAVKLDANGQPIVAPPPPAAPAGGSGLPPPAGVEGFVRSRNPLDYRAKRDALQADLKKRFG